MSWSFIPTAITTLLAVLTFLGVHKFFLEPWLAARQLRKKYATALWISCEELRLHLEEIQHKISEKNTKALDALKKIPDHDFNNRVDWFTKYGYYTTVTAYRIAVVSCWLHIYQRELLISPYRKSHRFVFALYTKADHLKRAFGENTCLWHDYFDAIGSRIEDHPADIFRPMSFGAFCDRSYSDKTFRKFYEQLHMFISFVAAERYPGTIDRIRKALSDLTGFLERENLLAGLELERSAIDPELAGPE